MQEYLIVCPNATKMSLLHKIYRERQKISVKFMSIEDFLDSYFYTYDYQAISFIMHKYNVTLCKICILLIVIRNIGIKNFFFYNN